MGLAPQSEQKSKILKSRILKSRIPKQNSKIPKINLEFLRKIPEFLQNSKIPKKNLPKIP